MIQTFLFNFFNKNLSINNLPDLIDDNSVNATGIVAIITGGMVILTSLFAIWWLFFGIIDSISNYKYRKEMLKNLKWQQFNTFQKSFYKIIEEIDNENIENFVNSEEFYTILSIFDSPIGKIPIKKIRNPLFLKNILLNNLKNLPNIDNDFMINKEQTISYFLKGKKEKAFLKNKSESILLLFIISIFCLTENGALLKYDRKYEDLINRISKYLKYQKYAKYTFIPDMVVSLKTTNKAITKVKNVTVETVVKDSKKNKDKD